MTTKEKLSNAEIAEELTNFEKKSWAIKVYAAERWGDSVPCPLRLVVNPYYSCSHKCAYCYVWSNKDKITEKTGFRKALLIDIAKSKKYNLSSYAIELSTSTDPFQPIELDKGESLFAIEELLKNNFKIVLVTKNPRLLLHEKYVHLLKEQKLFIDVTITSLKEGTPEGGMLNYIGPSGTEKLQAVKEIIALGKDVRVRIDPVVPSIDKFKGQSKEDLIDLTKKLAEIGVKLIITKTMRLSKGMPQPIIDNYYEYYKKNGILTGTTYILSKEVRRNLLLPIYTECQRNNVKFCPCCDVDAFADESVATCRVDDEPSTLNRDIMEYTNSCTGD